VGAEARAVVGREERVEVRKLTCPSCGAQLDIPSDLSRAHCVYCGSRLVVERADEAEREAIETHLELGRIALEAGNHQEALEHFNEALEADPNTVEAWIGKAKAAHGLSSARHDRLDEALRYIDEALELDSVNAAAKEAREEIKGRHSIWLNSLANEEWERACEIWNRYKDPDPLKQALQPDRRQKEKSAPHVRKAVGYLERAITLNPNDPILLKNIAYMIRHEPGGWAYGDPRPYEKARKFLEERDSICAELVALREEVSGLEQQRPKGGFGLLDRRRGQYSRVKKRIGELESLIEAAAALGIDTDI